MTDTYGIGCGIWPVILTDTVFLAACEWHGAAYQEDSWAQKNMTREEADKRFLEYMYLIAGNDKIARLQADIFYQLARKFGKLWWEGKK